MCDKIAFLAERARAEKTFESLRLQVAEWISEFFDWFNLLLVRGLDKDGVIPDLRGLVRVGVIRVLRGLVSGGVIRELGVGKGVEVLQDVQANEIQKFTFF